MFLRVLAHMESWSLQAVQWQTTCFLRMPSSILWGLPGGSEPGLGGSHAASLRLLLPLPRPIPNNAPAALANRARCCFGENTFWSLLSEPSQLTPTVEKTCQDKWEIMS